MYLVLWNDRKAPNRQQSMAFTDEATALSYACALIKTDHPNVRVFRHGREIAAEKIAAFCRGERSSD